MFIYPQKDGSVTWTGSFNQVEWDAWQAEHSTKTKVKAEAKAAEAEIKDDPEADRVKVEFVPADEGFPAPQTTPARKTAAKKGGGK